MCNASPENFKVLGKRLNKSQGKRPAKKTGVTTTVVRCRNCGLIFSNPMPIPKRIEDHYGSSPENYWRADYFQENEIYFKDQIDSFFRLHPKGDNLTALDIGAGIGKGMLALEKAGFSAYGIETSASFYKAAVEKTGIDEDNLLLSPLEEAVYGDDFFDFINFSATLEHLYNPSSAITKALKWLKPEGLIYIEVPSSSWLICKLANLYYKMIGTDYVGNISPMHPPYHLYEFSLESFKKHQEKNNYTIVQHNYLVCKTFMPKILDPILKKLMELTNTGMELALWLKKL